MRFLLAWFWMGLILASIFWYAFLLFYVGIKGGTEIISLGRNLSQRPESKDGPEPGDP
jgi:hypothetical protein